MVEWQKPRGSIVGDFSWPGFDSDVLLSERACLVLAAFDGWEPGPVEIVSAIRYPDDSELRDLWVTAWADLDPSRSSATMDQKCGTCGQERWTLHGAERTESTLHSNLSSLTIERVPRSGPGVVVTSAETAIFRIRQFPAWIFCTETVRAAIIEAGFTNVDFLEVGEVRSAA